MIEVDFLETLNNIRDSVEPELSQAYEIMQEVVNQAPGNLSKYMNELVSRKGKRMRACFVLLIAASGRQKSSERAAVVSCSIELLHLATLVHDDIIDQSDMRRNSKSAHKKWGSQRAVLIGDFALSKALELIINEEDRRIPSSISRAASHLIAGEVLEIDQMGNLNLTVKEYFEVIYGKTASLWETCGECGAILAGFNDEQVRKCATVGKNMGLAFQIIDDLLDFGVGAKDLGKEMNSDLQNGLITLPMILFFKDASQKKQEEMKKLLNNSSNGKQQQRIKELLQETDSFVRTKEMALEKIRNSTLIFSEFPRSEYFVRLMKLGELMVERTA